MMNRIIFVLSFVNPHHRGHRGEIHCILCTENTHNKKYFGLTDTYRKKFYTGYCNHAIISIQTFVLFLEVN